MPSSIPANLQPSIQVPVDDTYSVLHSPWIPLEQRDGIHLATLRALLTGETDAPDVAHARPQLRIATRALLSAIAQLLGAARDATELRRRLDEPMARADVDGALTSLGEGWSLLGPFPRFLQQPPREPATATGNDTHRLFHGTGDSRDPLRDAALCPACTVAALYFCQAWAPMGGLGYSPGVRGGSHVTTLIRTGSVRRDVWANVLAGEDGERIQALRDVLFSRPRAVTIARAAAPTPCAGCCRPGALIASAFAPGTGARCDGHPYSPCDERGAMTPPAVPLWALYDLLVVGTAEVRIAPVVSQWRRLFPAGVASVEVYASRFHRAKHLATRWATLPLDVPASRARSAAMAGPLVRRAIRDLERAVCRTCQPATSSASRDASRAFAQQVEPLFWAALEGGRLDTLQEPLGRLARVCALGFRPGPAPEHPRRIRSLARLRRPRTEGVQHGSSRR